MQYSHSEFRLTQSDPVFGWILKCFCLEIETHELFDSLNSQLADKYNIQSSFCSMFVPFDRVVRWCGSVRYLSKSRKLDLSRVKRFSGCSSTVGLHRFAVNFITRHISVPLLEEAS